MTRNKKLFKMDSKYPDSHQDVIECRKYSAFHDEHNKNNKTGETIGISDFVVACILAPMSIFVIIGLYDEVTKVDGFLLFLYVLTAVVVSIVVVFGCLIIIAYITPKIKYITAKQLAKIKSKSKIKFNYD